MPYDKLIKRLRECAAEVNGEKTLWHQAADAIEDLENRLNLWRQDKIRRWIPVTERLPQKADTYLVFVANVFQKSMTATTTALWGGQNFIVGDFVTVTHWMPLPKAPESEGE